jgi:hypothetical protein
MTRVINYDTEFIEDGRTIDLVSIGAVDDQGREFYRVSTEFDPAKASPWVRDNVLAQLPWDQRDDPDGPWRSRAQLAADLLAWLAPTDNWRDLELWSWYAAYDHVALAQLWGPMVNLPRGIPMFTRELQQRWEDVGRPTMPPKPANAHDALADARWHRELHQLCERAALPSRVIFPPPGPVALENVQTLPAFLVAAASPTPPLAYRVDGDTVTIVSRDRSTATEDAEEQQ